MKQKIEETIPNYEEYKNMSCVIIGPKETSKKTPLKKSQKSKKDVCFDEPEVKSKGTVLNNTLYEPNIINNLRALYKQYSNEFSNICQHVLDQKYKEINKNIYKFCCTPFNNNNGIMGCLILNTDQNRPEFFSQLSDYIKNNAEKKKEPFDLENTFFYLYPKSFNALDKLFNQLKIGDDSIIDDKSKDQLTRIILVNDIQSVNSVAFNIFIARMLEYNRRHFPKYNYVIIFDVAYDPKNLYDKFNVSFLSKIQFFTITNTPSNFLYHEILYNFIYKKNRGFYIPKSKSIKIVLDSINLHQISIESFKHYFKIILFQFFFMHQWNDDEYLLYLDELNEKIIRKEIKRDEELNKDIPKDKKSQKKKSIDNESKENMIDNRRREILEKKLIEIYSSSSELKELTRTYKILPSNINNEVEKLLNNYKEKMNNWKIFKLFYELFEGFITNYLSNSKNNEDSIYYFLYKFFQYDSLSNFDDIIKKRASAIYDIIQKLEDQIEALKNYFYPKFNETVKEVEPLLNDKDKKLLKETSKDLEEFIKGFDNIKVDQVSMISDNFKLWVIKLLKLNCFKKINEADDEQLKENCTRKYVNVYHKYLEYKYIIEPPLMKSFLEDLFHYSTTTSKNKNSFEIQENNFEFKNILRAYFKCLMNLDSTFKLEHFFFDFLIEFNIKEINEKNKDLVEKYKKVFLVLSYWFNLVGVFQRRKGRKQGFIKNYYSQVDYFDDNKIKIISFPNHK